MAGTLDIFIVDSFTNEPFKGNPAGVCLLPKPIQDGLMQSIAMELGLSETAFLMKSGEDNKYSIRFFSPKMEIPLCGHATLASSKILFKQNPQIGDILFSTIEGIKLPIRRDNDAIVMEFPVYGTTPAEVSSDMLQALGIEKIINAVYNKETNILLLEIDDSDVLSNLKPDFATLIKSHSTINGVLVTAVSKRISFDFESRYFWPWSGTNEDPVTGATHTFLTKYWSVRLSKRKMNSFQCSERTGFMEVELVNEDTVQIKAYAQIVLEGKINIE